jgi:peptidyl-prolyl cis-trans isomerase SurA
MLAALPPAASGAATSNSIVRVVNGRPILQSEVDDHMRMSMLELARRYPDPGQRAAQVEKLRREVLELLTERELILKEYEPLAVHADAQIEAQTKEMIRRRFVDELYKGDRRKFYSDLNESGMGYKKFYEEQKKNTIVEAMRSQFARPATDYITEEEKSAWLQKNEARFRVGGKIKLWSITIAGYADGKTPEQQMALAKEVRTSLLNGADFASLARTHSADSKRDDGGSWGWVEQKDLAAPFWPIVSKLESGKVSDVVPMGGSFYIFWVEARQPGKLRPRAEIEEEVERILLLEKRKKASDEWVAKLRRKASIKP